MKSLSIFKLTLGAVLILGCTILVMGCSEDAPPAVSPDDLPPEPAPLNPPMTNEASSD